MGYSREPVRIDVQVTAVGGGSFDLGYAIGVTADGPHALAETTMATVDPQDGTVRALPGPHRETLRRHLGDPMPMRRRR